MKFSSSLFTGIREFRKSLLNHSRNEGGEQISTRTSNIH
jgi:hypothetical protein